MAVSDLSFGTVLPGIPSPVSPLDVMHAGQFQIRGPATSSVRVELTLPTMLVSDGGALLPLSFGAGDGFVTVDGHGFTFDPGGPVIGALGSDGAMLLRLGGRALPGRPQAAGELPRHHHAHRVRAR